MVGLYIDTSSSKLIVALLRNNKLLEKQELSSIRTHNLLLLETIDNLLKNNCMDLNDINKIYITKGPGSFTGIRIGISVAKTLAYSLNIPIISISNLKLPIFSYYNKDYYISIIPDNSTNSYIGVYDKNYNTIKEELMSNIKIENQKSEFKNNIIFDNNKYDIEKIINYYSKEEENVHTIKPNYLKEVI